MKTAHQCSPSHYLPTTSSFSRNCCRTDGRVSNRLCYLRGSQVPSLSVEKEYRGRRTKKLKHQFLAQWVKPWFLCPSPFHRSAYLADPKISHLFLLLLSQPTELFLTSWNVGVVMCVHIHHWTSSVKLRLRCLLCALSWSLKQMGRKGIRFPPRWLRVISGEHPLRMTHFCIWWKKRGVWDVWLLSKNEGQKLKFLLVQVQANSVTNHRLHRGFNLPRNEKKLGKWFKEHIFILFRDLNMMQYCDLHGSNSRSFQTGSKPTVNTCSKIN